MRRWAVVVLVAVVVALFFGLGLQRYVTLEAVKASRQHVLELYAARPVVVLGAYFAAYVVFCGLGLPGVAVLTLAAGAVFGLAAGTVVVSFASSIGATLACVVSRYLFRGFVERRFGGALGRVNAGIAEEGALYLFSLRLIPVIPFFLINLLMGLTAMRLRTFYLVSQAGMFPATVIYVNAGRELGRIESLSGVVSPRVLISLALLGLFPLAARKLTDLVRSRRKRP